jgi:regulator of sigma E protease
MGKGRCYSNRKKEEFNLLGIITTIVTFIIILSILVLAHEFGHFITARLSGVKVEEFGLGYPPKIFGFKRGETLFSLNAIPFGGFCKMLGEEDPEYPGSLASKSHATRFLILSSGSLVNILLPIILFTISFIIPHNVLLEKVQITEVAQDSPAQMAGIEQDDIILEINGREVNNRSNVSFYIRRNLGNKVTILLQKPDLSQQEVTAIPRWKPPENQGAIGIKINGIDSTVERTSVPIWEAIPDSIVHCWNILILLRNEISGWFIQTSSPQIAGPVGIAQLTGEFAKAGISPLLEFAALISISLGIFNLFPFPGLDGGRIVFVGLEWIRRGRRISPKKEGYVHLIGFILLVTLLVVVTYFDILRIIQGESLIP